MSTFKAEVVPVTLSPHPNADTLSLVPVFDYTAIVRTVDFAGRDRAIYIPVDAIVPDRPEFAFLEGHRRIKAKRLRGVFSMGLLIAAPDGAEIGDDMTETLGIMKYDPDVFQDRPVSTAADTAAAPPGLAPCYTDIENMRRYRGVLKDGEPVIATEKIHGANARYLVVDGELHCGSRTRWVKDMGAGVAGSMWWNAARNCGLASKIPEGFVVYGEVYGQVQDLRYGSAAGEVRFRAFDVLDRTAGRYLDAGDLTQRLDEWGIDRVPTIYAGPFDFSTLEEIAEADSVVDGAGGIREGLVIRPVAERFDHMGRVVLKLISQRYLLRKGA